MLAPVGVSKRRGQLFSTLGIGAGAPACRDVAAPAGADCCSRAKVLRRGPTGIRLTRKAANTARFIQTSLSLLLPHQFLLASHHTHYFGRKASEVFYLQTPLFGFLVHLHPDLCQTDERPCPSALLIEHDLHYRERVVFRAISSSNLPET